MKLITQTILKVDRFKVRSIFLSSQTRQSQLVVLPGCIGESVLSGKTCRAIFLSYQTNELKVYQPLLFIGKWKTI